jgi:hypothetical protein
MVERRHKGGDPLRGSRTTAVYATRGLVHGALQESTVQPVAQD